MPEDSRTFIRLHDGMPDHPKVDPLSDRAFRLLVSTWCWCSRHLTDGVVPLTTWNKRGTPAARRELVEAGLAEVGHDRVVMHDYLDHQRSKDEVAELRDKRREAGTKGGKASASARANRQASASASAQANGKQQGSKTQAETETESLTNVRDVPPRPEVHDLCRHLADRIEGNGSKKQTITQAWLDSARLLLDRDKRPVDEAHRLIDWCQDSGFWKGNVMSMPKFREKYDRLRLQATEAGEDRPQSSLSNHDAWWGGA